MNNNKKQRLENYEPKNLNMSSQDVYDALEEMFSVTNSMTIDQNYLEHLKFISEAQVSLEDPLAMNNLGFIFLQEKNYQKAEEILNKAANLGNSQAMYNLGSMYYRIKYSDFEKQDASMASYLFHISYNAASYDDGNEDIKKGASYWIGYIYFSEKNYDMAELWFKRSAELGNTDAMSDIRTLYYELIDKLTKELNDRKLQMNSSEGIV
jgi:TPR repeat protein